MRRSLGIRSRTPPTFKEEVGSALANLRSGCTPWEIAHRACGGRARARALMKREFGPLANAPVYDASAKLWLLPTGASRRIGNDSPQDVFTILSGERSLAEVQEPRFACPVCDISAYGPRPDPAGFGFSSRLAFVRDR